MNQSIEWKNEDVVPEKSGWYAIMRADESLCLRAFGNDIWWIPLKDGWLSGLPPGFKWFGPLMPIDWDTPSKTEGAPPVLKEGGSIAKSLDTSNMSDEEILDIRYAILSDVADVKPPGDKLISDEDFTANGGVILDLGKS